MITVFKKIWNFSKTEQKNIKKSIFFAFLNSIFNALQFFAIYIMLVKIFDKTITYMDSFITLGILLIGLIGKIFTQSISQIKQTHAGYFMAANKRISIGEKIKRMAMKNLNDFNLGKLTSLSTTTLNQIEIWVPMLLVLVLGGFLNTFVFEIGLLLFNFKIGIAAIVGTIVFMMIISLMAKKSKRNSESLQRIQSKLTKEVLATIQGMQVIKAFNLSGENNKSLEDAFENSFKSMLKIEKTTIPYSILQRIIMGLTISVMIYLAIFQYISGEIILSKAIMLMIVSFIIFDGLIGAGRLMAVLRITENSIDSLQYTDEIENISEGQDNSPMKNYNIEFNNVHFSYDKRKILDGVSCIIKEKNMTAIVGPSGSGKTTFCNLIARFWDVQKGEITIGGKDIREYTISNLMKNISFVFQDVYLFEDTIENNIKFGFPEASREDVIDAARKAMCHNFISKLDNGYDTIIGKELSLSGGERQRISIARAILKDAPIIIFDEATANVDPENEDKLQKAIEVLTENKTVIMIAHRLKTIRNANQILVLKDGKFDDIGTHNELIKKDGVYKTLIQSKNKTMNWKLSN